MTLADRIRMITQALPSDSSAVTLTRADLVALLDSAPDEAPVGNSELTAAEVAAEVGRAPSTVRGWLISGDLRGYKLNGRDWRVPRASLRAYLEEQSNPAPVGEPDGEVDISAWRRVERAG